MNPRTKEYLKLNKNILVAFAASFGISAMAAQLLAEQSDYLNATYTLLVDYAVYFSVFGGLFYLDSRHKYRSGSGGGNLRGDLVKMITSLGIGEIVYTAARWFFQYYFLTLGHDPYIASMVGHVISTAIYMTTINLTVKATKLFREDGS